METRVSADPAAPRDRIRATVAGTQLELLTTGGERLHALLDLIAHAKRSVRMLFYIYKDDDVGTQVRDALADALGRGVKVKLLLDGYGCSGIKPNFFDAIIEGGGELCLFHAAYGRRYLLRNHQKLAIADEQRAIIGGANVQTAYLTDDGDSHWRDLWMVVDGPIVLAAADYFDALFRWTTRKGAKLRSLRRLVHEHSQFRGPLQWKFSGPLSMRNAWRRGIVRDIRAKSSLDLVAAYFSPPRTALRRLRWLAHRGKVRIITASRSDNNATIAAARDTYGRLLRSGVRMYEYQAARLHTKLAICDDITYVGSANFDFRSLYLNLEIMLRIKDAEFAQTMRRYFEEELAESLQITPELHERRATWLRRLKWRVSHWLVTSMDYTVTRRLNFRAE
jgi:cardiolipin synthase